MAKTARICVKIDPVLKEEAEKIIRDVGLTPSEFIRILYKQLVIHQGIPFEITTKKDDHK